MATEGEIAAEAKLEEEQETKEEEGVGAGEDEGGDKKKEWWDESDSDEEGEGAADAEDNRPNLEDDADYEDEYTFEKEGLACVAVGDDTVGKTSLLIAYACKVFPEEYVPTVFDNYSARLMVDGFAEVMMLCDTCGNKDYDQLRPLAYPMADVFLLCFSLNNPESLENIRTKFYPELSQHCPDIPMIVVGTKADLRDSQEAECLDSAKGECLAKDIGALMYLECSALKLEGLSAVFEEAARAAIASLTVEETEEGETTGGSVPGDGKTEKGEGENEAGETKDGGTREGENEETSGK